YLEDDLYSRNFIVSLPAPDGYFGTARIFQGDLSASFVKEIPVGGTEYLADHIILATSLHPAQELLKTEFPDHPHFRHMYQLQTMPSVTIQLELSERAVPKDRTTFAPETCLASFSEQN